MERDYLFDSRVRSSFERIMKQLEATRGIESASSSSDSGTPPPLDDFWATPRFKVADPEDVVQEIVSHLDLRLAKQWFEPWFVKAVSSAL